MIDVADVDVAAVVVVVSADVVGDAAAAAEFERLATSSSHH